MAVNRIVEEREPNSESWKSVEYSKNLPLSRFIFREDGKFVQKSTRDLFLNKRAVIFGVPGAFTPTCSNSQVPDYEAAYDDLIAAGVDEVYCVSVNDSYVMDAWRESLGIQKVKFLPDGNGFFTRQMGKNVLKVDKGLGIRSWRYAAIINSETFEVVFSEDGQSDNCPSDPYEKSTPAVILNYLRENGRPTSMDDLSEEQEDELILIQRIQDDIFLNK